MATCGEKGENCEKEGEEKNVREGKGKGGNGQCIDIKENIIFVSVAQIKE